MKIPQRIPLRALEIFEVVARLGSANDAAKELGISRSAVSQQIHRLEERVGKPLFEHKTRPARPTKAALNLLTPVTQALNLIDAACARVAEVEDEHLQISAPPSDAAIWLIPRMAGFRRQLPNVRVSVQNSTETAVFDLEGTDAALLYGNGNYPGMFVQKLADEYITPLASPKYLQQNPVTKPDDLASLALILDHTDQGEPSGLHGWSEWMAAAKIRSALKNIVMSTNLAHQALCLARAGEGAALGRGLMSVDEIQLGILKPILPFSLPTGQAHYFVCPHSVRKSPTVSRFADWLQAEFKKHRREMEEFFPPPRMVEVS